MHAHMDSPKTECLLRDRLQCPNLNQQVKVKVPMDLYSARREHTSTVLHSFNVQYVIVFINKRLHTSDNAKWCKNAVPFCNVEVHKVLLIYCLDGSNLISFSSTTDTSVVKFSGRSVQYLFADDAKICTYINNVDDCIVYMLATQCN